MDPVLHIHHSSIQHLYLISFFHKNRLILISFRFQTNVKTFQSHESNSHPSYFSIKIGVCGQRVATLSSPCKVYSVTHKNWETLKVVHYSIRFESILKNKKFFNSQLEFYVIIAESFYYVKWIVNYSIKT